MAGVTNMRPVSETLRRKIAVLEGIALPERGMCEVTGEVVELAREVPICSEKVLSAVMGWDDVALSNFVEAALDIRIQRLACCMSNDTDDTLLADIQTSDMKLLSVHLKGVMLLLPSTAALKTIMRKALLSFLEMDRKTVSVTIVRSHNSGVFSEYEVHGRYPWVKIVRMGHAKVEPWDAVELYFVSLQEYMSAGRSSGEMTLFEQWCWFLAYHSTVRGVDAIPRCVATNPHIAAVWQRLSTILSNTNELLFTDLSSECTIADAINMQLANTEADRERHAASLELVQHRTDQFKAQLDTLNDQCKRIAYK